MIFFLNYLFLSVGVFNFCSESQSCTLIANSFVALFADITNASGDADDGMLMLKFFLVTISPLEVLVNCAETFSVTIGFGVCRFKTRVFRTRFIRYSALEITPPYRVEENGPLFAK